MNHPLYQWPLVHMAQVRGVRTFFGISFRCRAAVLTTGTFMNGRIWVGRMSMPAGRSAPPSTSGFHALAEVLCPVLSTTAPATDETCPHLLSIPCIDSDMIQAACLAVLCDCNVASVCARSDLTARLLTWRSLHLQGRRGAVDGPDGGAGGAGLRDGPPEDRHPGARRLAVRRLRRPGARSRATRTSGGSASTRRCDGSNVTLLRTLSWSDSGALSDAIFYQVMLIVCWCYALVDQMRTILSDGWVKIEHTDGQVGSEEHKCHRERAQVHVERPQMDCYLTHTTAETHALIEANLAETPVYGGWVDAKGPRYCPSIEDKIVRFRDKDSHQVRGAIFTLHIRMFVPT